MKIKICQIYPTLGNLAKNYQKIAEIINAEKTADVLVFPELALTGYFLKDQVVDLAEETAKYLHMIQDLSAERDILIGAIEKTADQKFYNSAFYFSEKKLLHTHRKAYLPTYGMFDEKRYFSAGNQIRTFQTKYGKAVILICEDAWHLSSAYLAALDGAAVIFILSASPYREGIAEYWQNITQAYSKYFDIAVVYANRSGVEDGVSFWGGSEAYQAGGKLIAKAPELKEVFLDVNLDLAELQDQKTHSIFNRDERKDLVLRELNRLWQNEI